MRRASHILRLATLTASLLAAPPAGAVVVDGIAAVVNGDIITLLELERAGRSVLDPSLRAAPPAGQERRAALLPVLDQLVLERLQAQRARELGIQVSEQEVDAAMAGVFEENRLNDEMLERLLREREMTLADYRRELRGQILLQKLVRAEIGSRTTVSDAEIEAYFAEHAAEWRRPEKIRMRHLLVPLPAEAAPAEVEEARAKAAALRARAEAGADFADLVRAETPGAEPGIDPVSGEIARGELFPALEEAAFGLPVGGISEPVRGPAGFHLVQVADRTAAREPSLAGMRDGIEQKILDRKARERFSAWLKQLRESALVEIRY